MPAGLATPELPEELAYLMEWYRQLASRRPSGFSSPNPIAWAEVQAWATLMRQRLAPWQAKVLVRLDDLWRLAWEKGRKKPKPEDERKAPRARLPGRVR